MDLFEDKTMEKITKGHLEERLRCNNRWEENLQYYEENAYNVMKQKEKWWSLEDKAIKSQKIFYYEAKEREKRREISRNLTYFHFVQWID